MRKGDVTISKNYLTADEIDTLNRLVTGFLEFAELRAKGRQTTTMQDWVAQTDRFVAFNERAVLPGAGPTSHADMERIIHQRYEAFDKVRRIAADEVATQEALLDLEGIEREARRLARSPPKPQRPVVNKK